MKISQLKCSCCRCNLIDSALIDSKDFFFSLVLIGGEIFFFNAVVAFFLSCGDTMLYCM